jgi:hypothetical protein
VTETVDSIDHEARVLSLKDKTGKLVTIDVPEAVERFDEVKVGDQVDFTWTEAIQLAVESPRK